MKVEGSCTYPADPVVVWSLLSEPGIAARILPGCQVLETLDPHRYRAVLSLRVGKRVEQLAVALELKAITPGQALDFQADARSLSGSLKIDGHINLTQAGPGCSELRYDAEVDGDQFISVSSRMLTTTARAFARRSLEALDRELAIRTRVYSTTVLPQEPATTVTIEHRFALLSRVVTLVTLVLALVLIGRSLNRRGGGGEVLRHVPDLSATGSGQIAVPAERSAV